MNQLVKHPSPPLPLLAGVHLLLFIAGLAVTTALAGGAVHQFLALFNPRPTLQAARGAVPLGGELEVRYSFTRNTSRITKLQITLRGEEVATYRRGTDTKTDRHTFFEEVLLETTDPGRMRTGTVTIRVPGDLMHSFDASNNKIVWTLKLHGDIPRWPDVALDFPITVLPQPHSSPV